MPLENIQYDAIMREYGRRQLLSRHRLEEHRAHAQERIPRLKEIQDAIASASAQQIHSLLGGEKAGSTAVYREKVEALARERTQLLTENGFPPRSEERRVGKEC